MELEMVTSSEESDEQVVQDESIETKRSYDCTFCKRGFTNARALGGHMNIHRKERTNYKTKQGTQNSSPFVPIVSSQPSTYYCILESPRNYDMYLQPSKANPSPPSFFQYDFLNTNSQSMMGTNLSLQIGSSHEGNDHVWRGIGKDGEGVDLELRLGHDSYSNY
ncbi:transcriptional regulator TAC1-like [Trifolium pratense]|uniref:Uncharacterized protein n=1 Tax=Trifolium pratense TaxID=57577 RepID=A0ACB0M2Y6_TRIPR|nr:transcriptional regulator TAC1-like [Trifolium pratense]CAJ2673802.1 unnamed protein product [Trifolium pratense]